MEKEGGTNDLGFEKERDKERERRRESERVREEEERKELDFQGIQMSLLDKRQIIF